MLEEALNYAGRGWAVFPLSGYKIPFKGSRGHLDATTDRATIEAWWKARPKANLGLATGDLIVIDLDGPGALATPRGASLKAAADANGGLPPTLTSRTARGLHLFYRPPAGEVIRSSNEPRQAKGADGVDIKGHGGFVVLPPSINAKNGFQYKWQLDLPIAEMPGWLFAWIQGLGAVSSKQNEVTKLGAKPAYLQGNQLVVPRRSVKISAIECSPNELQRIVSALKAIPATSYDTWIEIGLALHSLGWDAPDGGSLGLDIWQRWSATAPEKYNPFEMEARWASFGRTGRAEVGIGTLFHHAGRHGWQQAAPAAVRVDDAVPRGEAAGGPAGEGMTGPGMNGHTSADHALPPHFTQAAARAPIQWLDVDHKGRARPTCRNARVAIRHMGLECSHDTFHDRMAIGGQSVAEWAGELTDNTVHMLRITIERVYGLDPGSSSTLDAAVQECLQGGFDPVADYLDGLTWDGVPRLRSWLAVYMGAAQTELNAAIGELMLVAAVRRVRQPGCKFDQILVLEGPEGRGKSSAIEIMAGGANFSDQTILTLDDKGAARGHRRGVAL